MGSDGGPMATDPETNYDTYFVPQGISADLIATLEEFSREDVDAYAARYSAIVDSVVASLCLKDQLALMRARLGKTQRFGLSFREFVTASPTSAKKLEFDAGSP